MEALGSFGGFAPDGCGVGDLGLLMCAPQEEGYANRARDAKRDKRPRCHALLVDGGLRSRRQIPNRLP